MIKSPGKTVAVGMSGGLDSTMAAYLLKQQGFTVIGLTMKIWDGSIQCNATRSACYGPNESEDISQAIKAAAQLGIKHYVVDLADEYNETVLEYFRSEYGRGYTPNPCIVCNSKIKFGALLDRAVKSGIVFDLFATGHYARITYDQCKGRYILKCGVDEKKDQSYFLYRLTPERMEKLILPLGEYRKGDVRELARRTGFEEYAGKNESQDFFEAENYSTLLNTGNGPGKVLDMHGNSIGTHRGIGYYTVGQRRSLNLSGMREPFYVISIDAARNEIIAGPRKYLQGSSLIAGNLHWIVPPGELASEPLKAKIRSAAVPADCTISLYDKDKLRVQFACPQEAITPGQSAVIYTRDLVAGGGVIEQHFFEQ